MQFGLLELPTEYFAPPILAPTLYFPTCGYLASSPYGVGRSPTLKVLCVLHYDIITC